MMRRKKATRSTELIEHIESEARRRRALIMSLRGEHFGVSEKTLRPIKQLLEKMSIVLSDGTESTARVRKIAEHCGVSRSTVQRRMRKAEGWGLIGTQDRTHETTGGQLSNHYEIQWDRIESLVKPPSASSPDAARGQQDAARGQQDAARGQQDAARGQQDAARGQQDAAPYKRESTREIEAECYTLSPPTPSNPEDTQTDWRGVEAALVREGVREWRKALSALQHMVTASHASAIIEHYADRPGCYRPTALYLRCQRAHPGLPPHDGWPDPLPQPCPAGRVKSVDAETAANSLRSTIRRKFIARHGPAQIDDPRLLPILARALIGNGLDDEMTEAERSCSGSQSAQPTRTS